MVQDHLDLQETDFGYSMKNILIPTQKEYIFALLGQTQSFMNRLRWKTFFILNPGTAEEDDFIYFLKLSLFLHLNLFIVSSYLPVIFPFIIIFSFFLVIFKVFNVAHCQLFL